MQSLRSMQQARTSLLVNAAAHPHSQLLATQAALLQNSTHPAASVLLNGSLQKTLQVSSCFGIVYTKPTCTLLIFKGRLKAYKRQKLCNFHIKDLSFSFRGICLLRERYLNLLKVIFFKIYRILPLGGKNVSTIEGIFL